MTTLVNVPAAVVPKTSARVASYILSGLGAAFLLMDATMKLLRLPVVIEGTKKVGFAPGTVLPLGIILAACTILYLIPRTSVFGAILLTGYLGGAVATHVRMGDPLVSHVLFPTYFAALLWLGLWLRDPRVRAIVPFRRDA